MENAGHNKFKRYLIMFALITSGEVVFLLPFVFARIFRPTFLDVFEISNYELGIAFSVYGFVAMLSYFAGGPLADRFSARRLMSLALLATSLGGVILAGIPQQKILALVYGFWGVTTILLFWAAMIRATREWGGEQSQGKAYGILDGGRGLVAALLASTSVAIFASLLPGDVTSATLAQSQHALTRIIWIFTFITLTIAVLVWYAIPEQKLEVALNSPNKLSLKGVREVLKIPGIWLQAIIVVCAYVGYKCTDDFSLYASDAFDYNDVAAAQIGTITFWIRPIAAVGAGILGDAIKPSKLIAIGFLILIIGSLVISFGMIQSGFYWLLIFTIVGTSVGIYAIRGLYFTLFQEAKVSLKFTGSAVGIVSFIGFTPDIFMGPLMGYLIDRSPGAIGHQHVFGVLAGFGLIGLIASVIFHRINKSQ